LRFAFIGDGQVLRGLRHQGSDSNGAFHAGWACANSARLVSGIGESAFDPGACGRFDSLAADCFGSLNARYLWRLAAGFLARASDAGRTGELVFGLHDSACAAAALGC
jgi:hypothetical protein